ncbi:MAG: TolC family protein [Candidatus Caldatribacterium sp.]|uniref:TolC family protein n=1 Tax=Candidatus Caldatribacterium sp. TaxID=2282143 RepID=UPI0029919FB7|nr:TolC family protein [Candidatus Caldatribacterium sp.]MCX7730236.1 TolC family protein [Candidatus Caldatribacterium sp.]MDW8081028.1 TolC family protein [Candidatus Calescibacterium sp.]
MKRALWTTFVVWCGVLLLGFCAFGEEAKTPPSLSLKEALTLGLQESRTIRRAEFTVKLQELAYREGKANLLLSPSVVSELQLENTWRSAQRSFALSRMQLALEIEEAYYNVLKAERAFTLAQENLARVEKQLEDVRTKFSLGVVAKIDVLRSELEVDRARLEVEKARENLALSRMSLGSILGRGLEAQFTLSSSLDFVPEAIDLDACIQYALAHRPEVKEKEETLALRKKELEVLTSYTPPLEREKTKIRLAIAETELADVKESIILEVRQRFSELLAAQKNVPIAEKSVAVARETLNVQRARFEAGVITLLDLLDAQNDLYEAENAYLQAVFDYNIARAKFFNALGADIEDREKLVRKENG